MDDRILPNSGAVPGAEATDASEAADGSAASPRRADDAESEATAPDATATGADASAAAEPATDHEHENHEAKLEHDLEELAAKAQKADEYLELAQRTKADFENYRKRAARETAAAQERGVTRLARELLPAVDSLDRALDAAQQGGKADDLVSGIKLVHAEVLAALARVGVEPFSPDGERFDPEIHEAVAQQPVDGKEPGTVVEVYQRGYRIGDSVIRPAKVVVAG